MFFFFGKDSYIAIIADIKQSKQVDDRKEVQRKLKETLDFVNEKYSADISARFVITLGDEFQGLLSTGINIMNIINVIEQRMYPISIRFGVGIGKITTDINSELAIGADGPGYHRAREAVEYLKRCEKKKETYTGNIRFAIDCDNGEQSLMLNTIADLMFTIKSSWSERQREVIWNMLEYQSNQSNVAKQLQIAQPTVQKALAAGRFYAYKQALDTLSSAMKEIKVEDV